VDARPQSDKGPQIPPFLIKDGVLNSFLSEIASRGRTDESLVRGPSSRNGWEAFLNEAL
jgi:hypothetical protein